MFFLPWLFVAACMPESDRDMTPTKIDEAIVQLDADEFLLREAAMRDLVEIGPSVLDKLRSVANSGTPEQRWRATQVEREIRGQSLARLAGGKWQTNIGEWFIIDGEKWSSGTKDYGPYSGRIRILKVEENRWHVDLEVKAGPTAGQTVRTILELNNNELSYCGTYGQRPLTIAPATGRAIYRFQRAEKPIIP
jgi:hypothetical protein